MNKYKSLSRKLRKERAKEKMCLNKKAYETKEFAYQKGQESYNCKHCGKWHRSGKMTKFIVGVRKFSNNNLPKNQQLIQNF